MEDNLFLEEENVHTQLPLTDEGLMDFKAMRRWTMFIAIFQAISLSFALAGAVAMFISDPPLNNEIGVTGRVTSLFYLLAIAIGLVPIVILIKFSQKAKKAIKNNGIELYNSSIKLMKNYFMSIALIIIGSSLITVIVLAFLISNGLKMGPLF